MLSLGLRAWDMISTQQYKEPKLDVQLVTKFLPALMSLIVDDQVRSLGSRLPQDDRESAITTIEHSGPPPDAYQAYVQENAVASMLAVYYTFHTARQRDRTGVMRVLGSLAGAEGQRAYHDPFLHTLVGHLALMTDDFAQEDFCTVVFDEFFLTGLSASPSGGSNVAPAPAGTPAAAAAAAASLAAAECANNTARHLLRLLWHVHAKLPPARLQGLMKTLQPLAQANEGLKPAVQALQDKLKDTTPPAAEPEQHHAFISLACGSLVTSSCHHLARYPAVLEFHWTNGLEAVHLALANLSSLLTLLSLALALVEIKESKKYSPCFGCFLN
ncbi:hypothetical protein V5799_001022 [Amblyomma americanum]|uniref:Uncharacterized protein n=1 Tax=Amblyomma americanum TaxID=6943 RepID=A0AAQ4D1D6_AMBAM